MEVKGLNCGTELVFCGHIEVLGSIVKHSPRRVNSVDLVAWEFSLHWLVVPAAALHAKKNVPSLALGLSAEVYGQDLLSECEDLSQLHLVGELVDTGLGQSILYRGVLKHNDSPSVVWLKI